MANIFGAIGLQDSDRLYSSTVGQRILYEISQQFIDQHNADMPPATAIFIGGQTDMNKERFKLAGGGFQQRRGRNSAPGQIKQDGQWDVAYPLFDFGDAIGGDDVSMAYMTAGQWTIHLQSIFNRDVNTYRREMLRALFNNTSYTFSDEVFGDLTVQPLANGDSVVYPPLLGSYSEAIANYYIGSNFASSGISDTNNPVKLIVSPLQKRYGTPTGGSNIAVFYNSAEHDKISALTDFVEVQYRYVEAGDNTPLVKIPGIPDVLLRSSWEVTGTCSGAIMCKWEEIPSGYMIGVHLDAPPPLIERVDPADTGLGTGLQLVAEDVDRFMDSYYWRHRYGLAVRNRINGIALQLVASTTYTTPTVFA